MAGGGLYPDRNPLAKADPPAVHRAVPNSERGEGSSGLSPTWNRASRSTPTKRRRCSNSRHGRFGNQQVSHRNEPRRPNGQTMTFSACARVLCTSAPQVISPLVVRYIQEPPVDGLHKENSVKGLMYNLLESLAKEAGCSFEAWELVAEFAAVEPLAGTAEDVTPPDPNHHGHSFDVPTEAMLGCLSQGTNLLGMADAEEEDGEDSEQALDPCGLEGCGQWLRQDSIDPFSVKTKDVFPGRSGGFGPESFCSVACGDSELPLSNSWAARPLDKDSIESQTDLMLLSAWKKPGD